MPYDLLFERFLNPERVSMPDFDVDFARASRRVIGYVANRYGQGGSVRLQPLLVSEENRSSKMWLVPWACLSSVSMK